MTQTIVNDKRKALPSPAGPLSAGWLKSIHAAQTEGTGSAGGYAVPDLTADVIQNSVSEHGIAQRVASTYRMDSDALTVAKWAATTTVDLPGEAAAITASDKTYGSITLSAVKRSVLHTLSNELLADSRPDLVDDLVAEASYNIAKRQDLDLIQGDGTSSYGSVTGLVSRLGAGGTTTASGTTFCTVTLANLQAVAGDLSSRFYRPGQLSWIMSHEFFAQHAVPLCHAVGLETWRMVDGSSQPALFGFPVHLTDAMPAEAASAVACLFGNWPGCVAFGSVRDGLNVQLSSRGVSTFGHDASQLRLNWRYDIQVHEYPDGGNPSAFSGLKLAAS